MAGMETNGMGIPLWPRSSKTSYLIAFDVCSRTQDKVAKVADNDQSQAKCYIPIMVQLTRWLGRSISKWWKREVTSRRYERDVASNIPSVQRTRAASPNRRQDQDWQCTYSDWHELKTLTAA